MSSILKALKKLEQEKQQPAGPMDHASRYGDSPAPGPRRPQKTLLLLLCGMLAGLLAAGGLMLWSGQGSGKEKSEQLVVAPSAERASDRPVIPSQGVDRVAEEGTQSGIPGQKLDKQTEDTASADGPANSEIAVQAAGPAEASKAIVEIAVPAAGPVPAATVKPPAVVDSGNQAAETSAPVEAQAGKVQADIIETAHGVRLRKKSELAANQPTAVPPTDPTGSQTSLASAVSAPFQVMEIFYQPEEGSMAVVDDLPVMEGTVVNDVLVEKIFPDRVRFIIDGQAVEVLAGEPQP